MSDVTSSTLTKLKKYLPDPVLRIELHDLMIEEVTATIESFQALPTELAPALAMHEEYAKRVRDYEGAMARLLPLLVTGAYHSDTPAHDRLWARCVDHLASRPVQNIGGTVLIERLRYYPALLALYAVALGAAASDRIDSIARVLGSVYIHDTSSATDVRISVATTGVLNGDAMKKAFPALVRRVTPTSDHLLEVLRPLLASFVPSDHRLDDLFDEIEYLMGMLYARHSGGAWAPTGRAVWRWAERRGEPGRWLEYHAPVLVEAGLFDDLDQYAEIREAYGKVLRASPLWF